MARLMELESSGGYVTLQDGTKFRLKDSGISMLFNGSSLISMGSQVSLYTNSY